MLLIPIEVYEEHTLTYKHVKNRTLFYSKRKGGRNREYILHLKGSSGTHTYI